MVINKPGIKLSASQLKILDIFRKSELHKKFYWTGGTLLSYCYLQHRKSLDLDFFTDNKFSYRELIPFLDQIKIKFKGKSINENKIYDRWDFVISNGETIRFEFVYYNGQKKRLKPLNILMGIKVDSLEDIAANKVIAYFDRNEPKDLFDIYFLLKNKFSLNVLLKLAEKKFGFSCSHLTFWSESTKSLKKLSTLKPLLFEKKTGDQGKLLEDIEDFFLSRGSDYLSEIID